MHQAPYQLQLISSKKTLAKRPEAESTVPDLRALSLPPNKHQPQQRHSKYT